MVRTALAPPAETATIVDARWVAQTANQVLAVMEETWQMSGRKRNDRSASSAGLLNAALVDLLVDEVLLAIRGAGPAE